MILIFKDVRCENKNVLKKSNWDFRFIFYVFDR